jgi:hypothetical protein
MIKKRPPYPGFTKYNKRRQALEKQFSGPAGLCEQEIRELHLLNEICRLMIQYRWDKCYN